MSSDITKRPASPVALAETENETSLREEAAPSSSLPHSLFCSGRDDEDGAGSFSDDAASCMDDEADHSMTDFDLADEITRKLDEDKTPERASSLVKTSPEPERDDYFPEDEVSSMDWEADHSMTDFDMAEELNARLGQAVPEETAPAAPSLSPPPAPLPPEQATPAPEGDYYPEDELSPMDGEADHSMTDFDMNEEVRKQLDKEESSVLSGSEAGRAASPALGEDYFPEDEDSPMEHEADHSLEASEHNNTPGTDPVPEASAPQEEGYVHPGLAAALAASLNYARKGVDGEDAEADEPGAVRPDAAAPAGSGSDVESKDAEAQNPARAGSPRAASASASLAPSATRLDDNGDDDNDDDDDDDDDDKGEAEEDEPERPMTLRDHLNELRKRLFRAFLWVLVGFSACYPFAEELLTYLFAPLKKFLPEGGRFIYTSPPEAFFTYLKVAFVAGIFAASPLIFYQIWAFVAPGLYKEEKAYIVPIAFFSALFFICGGAFCYFITFPFAFEFFMSYSTEVIVAMPSLKETLSFVLQLLLAFGVVFELPLFVFFLARLGILTAAMMRKFRRYAVLVNLIVAAILTPPDVMSQLLMAGPLLLLYEASVLIAVIFGKKKPQETEVASDDDDDDEDDEDRAERKPLSAESADPTPSTATRMDNHA